MSDIRVSVKWKNSTVFAGEDIECTITFKNISHARNAHRSPSPSAQLRRHGSSRERWKETLPARSTKPPASSNHRMSKAAPGVIAPNSKMHKPTLSLSTSHSLSSVPLPGTSERENMVSSSANHNHRRSVSIVSIGGETIDEARSPGSLISSGRPVGGHVRAASLQPLSKRFSQPGSGPQSAPGNGRAFTVPSPLLRSSTSFAEQRSGLQSTKRLQSTGNQTELTPATARKGNRSSVPNFKFPNETNDCDVSSERAFSPHIQKMRDSLRRAPPPMSHSSSKASGLHSPPTRIFAPISVDDTPRSSGEFYSLSNNSTETLASEYVTRENSRLIHRPVHSRQGSSLAPVKVVQPEVLMMGYAQISGSFVLDGSLVNQSPFEGARKKGIVGGQAGGGVVRSESTKRDSGILGSIGWGNIGDSIGGFLTSNEMSTIKEAKGSSDTRAVPILSTPQSILFVDLRLAPGESKRYTYRHSLPRGIPPTHKGRAIKISYKLIVGTQRAAKFTQQHQVQHADIPFRVLPSVNRSGEILGHDLMSPHTILSDIASISSIDNREHDKDVPKSSSAFHKPNSSPKDFLSYIEHLVQKPSQSPGASLLSPTEPETKDSTIWAESSNTMKEAVDLAILKSNLTTFATRSANRFEISRSGDRVAVIMLARPAYRLGETIPVVIDFVDSDISSYALHATLESSEIVDSAISLRSKASIHRATRRVHASHSECTVAAEKVLFNPVIPITSTPDFITSGISLEWRLRFEFVTSRVGDDVAIEDREAPMEEVARDERGSVKAALQGLPCESFDVAVPLRVYGASASFDEKTEPGELPV